MYCLCYLIKDNKYIFKRQLGVQIKPAPGFQVRLLAPGKETVLGDSLHLALYHVSARKPRCERCPWAGAGSRGRSISLGFSNPHLAGAWDWELCCSLAASGSSFSSSIMTRSCSAASSGAQQLQTGFEILTVVHVRSKFAWFYFFLLKPTSCH